jgi:hypothetical protein
LVSKRSVSSSFLYPLQKEIARGKTGWNYRIVCVKRERGVILLGDF